MVANEPGFQVASPRLNDKDKLKGKAFYWDPIHPDGMTGARVIAELTMHLIKRIYEEVTDHPVTKEVSTLTHAGPLMSG